MITTEEVRRDPLSAEQLAGREREVESRRRDLASQIHRLEKRAQELGVLLAALDPTDEVSAGLEGEVEDVQDDLAWARYGLYQLVADAMAVVDEDGDTLSVAAALKQIEAERGQVYGSKHFVGPMDASGRRCPQNRQTEQLLGMRGKDNGRAGSLRLFIPYEVALAFMRALDMSPQQAGL
jgi:hypothetical protein